MANTPNRDNDLQRTTGSGATAAGGSVWESEDRYWRESFGSRPYAKADRGYDFYRPGYRYGVESAERYRGREWNEVEPDMRSNWGRYEHRGERESSWDDIKDAARDAWDRARGRR